MCDETDLAMIAQWSGHEQLETAQIYAYADTEARLFPRYSG